MVKDRYRVGFIPPDHDFRIKQGLMPQNIANDCNSIGLSGTSWSKMYPTTDATPQYQLPGPKDSCPCLHYLHTI